MLLRIFLACFALSFAFSAAAQEVGAKHAGFAAVPAGAATPPPAEAPAFFKRSGRYALEADAFEGQQIQGFSGVTPGPDGAFWALSDNGYGLRDNSLDSLLAMHLLRFDWRGGEAVVERSVFLRDPQKLLPFAILTQATTERYLTGADLDPEGVVKLGELFWFSDEFGPYLFATDETGVVRRFIDLTLNGAPLRSVDAPGRAGAANIRRSRGLEGLSAANGRLITMLEGPMNEETTAQGAPAARIFEVAPATGITRSWLYPLEDARHTIGDISMIGPRSALVIERDGAQGDKAKFKRVYRVELEGAEDEDGGAKPGAARKTAYIDLLNIEARAGRFRFPFQTIEAIAKLDDETILVGADNNYPFSRARTKDTPDASEWILLKTPELLQSAP